MHLLSIENCACADVEKSPPAFEQAAFHAYTERTGSASSSGGSLRSVARALRSLCQRFGLIAHA